MKSSKKAVQTHILFVAVVAIIMSLTVGLFMDANYSNQHQSCQDLDFEILKACKKGDNVILKIKNNADGKFVFELNGNQDIETFKVMSKKSEEFTLESLDSINIIPLIDFGQLYKCQAEAKVINGVNLEKC